MESSKRKIGQGSLWQKFYDKYVLLRHHFRYELSRKPGKLVKDLKIFWLHQHGTPLSFKELREQQSGLWVFDLSTPENFSQILGEIYRQDEKTVLEGTIIYRTTILAEIFIVSIVNILIVLPMMFGLTDILYRFVVAVVLSGTYCYVFINHLASVQRLNEAIALVDLFVVQGKFISEEWESLHGQSNTENEVRITRQEKI